LFHIDVAEGKKDFLNLSVLDLYKVIFSEFLFGAAKWINNLEQGY
jgi:hypothetical protein